MEKIKEVIKNQWLMTQKWIQNNQKEFWILVAILLVGAFFRLYRISEYMTFLGDEGRDAIVVRRLLVDFDPILVGPGTSIGDMYLGPLYYYLMAPALLLANFSPAGPAIMIALLGMATIYLVWHMAREWFGKKASVVSSLLYAISPVVINYSKSSWNPNIMPFFALLCIYSIWRVWRKVELNWLFVIGISFAFVLQSHYLGLLLIPTLGLFWSITFLKLFKVPNLKKVRNLFLKHSLISLFAFVVLMSPLIIFDARHGWRNYEAIKLFFTQRQTTISLKPWKATSKIWPIFRDNFVTRIVAGGHISIGKYTSRILSVAIVAFLMISLKQITRLIFDVGNQKRQNSKFISGFFLVFTWMFVGLIGMGLYKQHVYDHYFGFMFAAPFLLIGALSEKVYSKLGSDGKIFLTAGLLFIILASLLDNPLRYPPNFQLKRSIEVAERIKKEAGGKQFNLAVIAERNYEDGYQYFLEKEGEKVIDIDAQRPETVANQLFVVCEMSKEKCDPTHSPKAQVANFGWSKIDDQWDVMGVTVYKLVHTN